MGVGGQMTVSSQARLRVEFDFQAMKLAESKTVKVLSSLDSRGIKFLSRDKTTINEAIFFMNKQVFN